MELNEKVIVITGSSRGFGFALAEAFLKAGAQVMLSSRSQTAVDKAIEALRGVGPGVAGQACDVGDLAQVQALLEAALQRFGRVDVWINNAGVSPAYGPTLAQDPRQFRQVVETNVLGAYHGSLTAMRYFVDAGHGKLINILGRGDKGPAPLQNAYGSSKTWLRSFTLALAEETKGSGVGVYALNPGMMDTELLTDVDVIDGYEDRLGSTFTNVVQALSQPPQVSAAKALWLASPATDGKTGLVVSELNGMKVMARFVRHGVRKGLGRPVRKVEMHVSRVKPDWQPKEKQQ